MKITPDNGSLHFACACGESYDSPVGNHGRALTAAIRCRKCFDYLEQDDFAQRAVVAVVTTREQSPFGNGRQVGIVWSQEALFDRFARSAYRKAVRLAQQGLPDPWGIEG